MKTVTLEKIHALSQQLAEQLSHEVVMNDVDLLHLKSRIRLVQHLARRLLERGRQDGPMPATAGSLGMTPVRIGSTAEKSFAT